MYNCILNILMEYYLTTKRVKCCHCNNMEGPQGHYAMKCRKIQYYMISLYVEFMSISVSTSVCSSS